MDMGRFAALYAAPEAGVNDSAPAGPDTMSAQGGPITRGPEERT
jgi:hypothetical protein